MQGHNTPFNSSQRLHSDQLAGDLPAFPLDGQLPSSTQSTPSSRINAAGHDSTSAALAGAIGYALPAHAGQPTHVQQLQHGAAGQGAAQPGTHSSAAAGKGQAAGHAQLAADDPLMTRIAASEGTQRGRRSEPLAIANAHAAGANAVQRDIVGSMPRGPVASPNVAARPFDTSRHNMYAGSSLDALMGTSPQLGSMGLDVAPVAAPAAADAAGETGIQGVTTCLQHSLSYVHAAVLVEFCHKRSLDGSISCHACTCCWCQLGWPQRILRDG